MLHEEAGRGEEILNLPKELYGSTSGRVRECSQQRCSYGTGCWVGTNMCMER